MKDTTKTILICLMLGISMLLFAAKSLAQTGEFTQIILRDQYGDEIRDEPAKITLGTGFLEITEQGHTWKEKILLQTKSPDSCEVDTPAGHYLLIFEKDRLKKAYLRSNVGADRVYLAEKI